tara:strand:+ start:3087 stop:3371 length:285 start_codon:yes stop_codon:yes gene_type:complete
MAHIYWNKGDKVDKKEAIEALMKELVKVTDTTFTVRAESDDAGSHLVAYIERTMDDEIPDKKDLPDKFLGWRLLVVHVHEGYIKYVMNSRRHDD